MWNGNFKTALNSLRLSKWRTIFTMLGIIIGISSVVTIVSLGEGLKHQVTGQISSLGKDVISVRSGKILSSSNNLNFLALFNSSTLTPSDVDNISHLPSVATAVPIDFATSTISGGGQEIDNTFVAGTTAGLQNLIQQPVKYGGPISDSNDGQAIAVIGIDIARKLFRQSNAVGQSLNIDGQTFIVHGVFARMPGSFSAVTQSDFNSSIFIPFKVALDLTGGHDNILQILVKSKGSDVTKTAADVNQALRSAHHQTDFTVLTQAQLIRLAGGAVGTATGFIGAIAAISLLVGGIGIMDVMLVSISERTREIGIRKAIGATDSQILMQFMTEGLALTIGGGIIGILISLAVNQLLRLYTSWQPIINIWVVVLAVGVAVSVGLIFSIAPAFKAARKDPIAALRID